MRRTTLAAHLHRGVSGRRNRNGRLTGCGGRRDPSGAERHRLPAEPGRLPPPPRAPRLAGLRTANPIESVFATVRHRTVRTKGALSQDTARLMVFKLVMAAAKTWRRLRGQNQLPKVIQGVTFRDGVEVTDTPEQTAA